LVPLRSTHTYASNTNSGSGTKSGGWSDTIEANESLGFPSDLREYSDAAKIISLLQVKSVDLLTNNPEKIEGLEKEGIEVIKRIPIHATPNNHNKRYLATKIEKMGHLV
jgi:GTP cyclohydrolase II